MDFERRDAFSRQGSNDMFEGCNAGEVAASADAENERPSLPRPRSPTDLFSGEGMVNRGEEQRHVARARRGSNDSATTSNRLSVRSSTDSLPAAPDFDGSFDPSAAPLQLEAVPNLGASPHASPAPSRTRISGGGGSAARRWTDPGLLKDIPEAPNEHELCSPVHPSSRRLSKDGTDGDHQRRPISVTENSTESGINGGGGGGGGGGGRLGGLVEPLSLDDLMEESVEEEAERLRNEARIKKEQAGRRAGIMTRRRHPSSSSSVRGGDGGGGAGGESDLSESDAESTCSGSSLASSRRGALLDRVMGTSMDSVVSCDAVAGAPPRRDPSPVDGTHAGRQVKYYAETSLLDNDASPPPPPPPPSGLRGGQQLVRGISLDSVAASLSRAAARPHAIVDCLEPLAGPTLARSASCPPRDGGGGGSGGGSSGSSGSSGSDCSMDGSLVDASVDLSAMGLSSASLAEQHALGARRSILQRRKELDLRAKRRPSLSRRSGGGDGGGGTSLDSVLGSAPPRRPASCPLAGHRSPGTSGGWDDGTDALRPSHPAPASAFFGHAGSPTSFLADEDGAAGKGATGEAAVDAAAVVAPGAAAKAPVTAVRPTARRMAASSSPDSVLFGPGGGDDDGTEGNENDDASVGTSVDALVDAASNGGGRPFRKCFAERKASAAAARRPAHVARPPRRGKAGGLPLRCGGGAAGATGASLDSVLASSGAAAGQPPPLSTPRSEGGSATPSPFAPVRRKRWPADGAAPLAATLGAPKGASRLRPPPKSRVTAASAAASAVTVGGATYKD